jgi:hypothetical protein
MGISATTKHKEAERGYKERETLHDQVIARFNEDVVRTSEAIDALESEYLSARDAIINSQALRVDENGNIGYGWYGPFDSTHADNDGPNMQQSAIGSAPAFVAATAAWIGRAATLGLGGMTAGRFALGPSALASLPVQAAIGAKIAGNRERKAIANYDAAVQEMDRRETIAARCTPYLQEYRPSARQMTTTMARHTHQLETSDVGGQPAQDAVTRLAVDMEQAESLIRKFAETIEQAQSEFNP